MALLNQWYYLTFGVDLSGWANHLPTWTASRWLTSEEPVKEVSHLSMAKGLLRSYLWCWCAKDSRYRFWEQFWIHLSMHQVVLLAQVRPVIWWEFWIPPLVIAWTPLLCTSSCSKYLWKDDTNTAADRHRFRVPRSRHIFENNVLRVKLEELACHFDEVFAKVRNNHHFVLDFSLIWKWNSSCFRTRDFLSGLLTSLDGEFYNTKIFELV